MAVGAATTVAAEAVHLLKGVATTVKTLVEVVAITAVVHAPPTRVSQGKIRALAQAMARLRVASAARKPRALRAEISTNASHACRATTCNARTHAARVLTWAISPITLTNANRPAMCQLVSHRLVYLRAALVAVAGVATGAAVACAAAVAGVIQAADFGVDGSVG